MEQHGTIIYLEDITVSFDGFQVLRGVDFYVDRGELRALIGPNGAGKTTLLDVICGKVKPHTGRIVFGDRTDLTKLEEHEVIGLGIGRKFQTPAVFRNLTLVENLGLALRTRRDIWATLFGATRAAARDKIAATLELLGLLPKAQQQAGALSHGEMQWLEIGMVMMQEPALFLLDEPVAGMTRDERERTGQLLQRIAQEHAVLVVEHDMEFVRQTAHRVTVLHEGYVLCEGAVDMVQRDPRVIEVYLGEEDIAPMLTIHGLNTYYGDSQVLWDVHLQVPPGQVVCLLGRNGVGKTTLLKSLMGLLKPRSGTIAFHGQPLMALPSDQRARCGIGYVPQGRDIFPDLTVLENLRVGLVARGQGQQEIPSEIFTLFPVLQTMLARKGGLLSGGQQQQLAIARALVTEPSLLLLDEPTEGIQPSIILEIEDTIRQLKATGRMGILLVEQYLDFARRLADYVYVMEKGTVVLEGKLQELQEADVTRYLAV